MNPNPNKRTFLHTSPAFALYGRDLTLHAVKPGRNTAAEGTEMDYSVNGSPNRTCKMAITGTYTYDDMTYTVLSVTIPATDLSVDGEVTYSLYEGGKKSGVYTVPIVREGKLPPLAVTEIYGRCKHPAQTHYLELTNPTREIVDLYDYKLMMHSGEELSPDAPVRENMLAEEPGKTILQPGETVVLRIIPVALHQPENEAYLSDEAFCAALTEQVYDPAVTYTPADMRIIPLELGRLNEETGLWEPKVNSFELSIKYSAVTLLIAPRGGSYDNAVFRMVYNGVKYHHDTPVRFSSTWKLDIRHPEQGVNITHHTRCTPGKLDRGQAVPDLTETAVPDILPLNHAESCYLADGDLTVRFAVGGAPACEAKVHVLSPKNGFATIDAYPTDEENIWSATVPQSYLRKTPLLQYYITATGNFREGSFGSPEACLLTHILDNEGPVITKAYPSEAYATTDGSLTFRVSYEDISGVDMDPCILCVDGKNVTAQAKWTVSGMTYRPQKPLKPGAHTYELFLRDRLGNKTYRKFHFSIAKNDEMYCYRGEVHCHTGDSDGMLTPAEAIEYARDIGGADYFAVTDHSHHEGIEIYHKQIEIANHYDDPGRFACLYGWEMTWNNENGLWGHMNVLNTDWMEQDIGNVSMPELFEMLKKDPEAIAMFNHPGLAWGNFDEFGFLDEDIDPIVALNEIKGAGYDREYSNSLHQGWHTGPVFNEDNHGINWTTATPSTGYVVAPALTRDNVLEAFRARRTYTTGDNTLKLYYTINGEWLGSHLNNPEKLDVSIRVHTDSEMGIGTIQLIAEDSMVVACVDVGARQDYEWKFTVPPSYDYYYVKIVNGKTYTASAPIWIDGDENGKLSITDMTLGSCGDDYRPNSLSVTLKNSADAIMTDVRVNYYLTGVSGPDLTRAKPYETVYLKNMLAGSEKTVVRGLPNLPGMRRVTAIVSAKIEGKRYCDTDFTMLTPIVISEILPATSSYVTDEGETIPEAYRFVELYNGSNREQSLNGYTLRLWHQTGKAPHESRIQPLDGITIEPKSCVVLWISTPDSPMTADDFNLRFGTSLVEGKDLFRIERPVLDRANGSRRLDLTYGSETLSRVHYNFGMTAKGLDVHEDRSLIFAYRPTITGTSIKLSSQALPTPGTLIGDQRPQTIFQEPKKEEKKAEKRHEFTEKHGKTIQKGRRVAGAVATAALAAAVLGTIRKHRK